MKPGEFVNWEGKPAKVEYVGVRTLDDNYCLFPEQADFPAAVAALQSLLPKPTVPLAGVHPGVGLRWCGEEGHGEEFIYLNADWRMRFYDKADHFCGPWDLERRTDNGWDARVEPGPSIALLAFQAGRAYERWQS